MDTEMYPRESFPFGKTPHELIRKRLLDGGGVILKLTRTDRDGVTYGDPFTCDVDERLTMLDALTVAANACGSDREHSHVDAYELRCNALAAINIDERS